MTAVEKNLERKLRRALYNSGYSLHKARGCVNADNLGGYMIVAFRMNSVAAGSMYELSLEDVENFVRQTCIE